jgi:hypothetical protein
MKHYAVADHVIYRKQKVSAHPGQRARQIRPSEKGEDYYYLVDKYWVVSAVLYDGSIEVMTRTGKRYCLRPDDPNLHKPSLIEELVHRDRFPRLPAAPPARHRQPAHSQG